MFQKIVKQIINWNRKRLQVEKMILYDFHSQNNVVYRVDLN